MWPNRSASDWRKAAIAAKVNGEVVDLDREFPSEPAELSFQVLTDRDPESLEVLRHSSAQSWRGR